MEDGERIKVGGSDPVDRSGTSAIERDPSSIRFVRRADRRRSMGDALDRTKRKKKERETHKRLV